MWGILIKPFAVINIVHGMQVRSIEERYTTEYNECNFL